MDSSRLSRALAPQQATIVQRGALRVAFTGPAPDSGGLLCLLDGRVDNAAELGKQLGDPGCSSLERLLAAGYRRWGRDLPARLRGDFALLVWDGDRGEGLLARDQLGVRPMFLHRSGASLCFAGEIRDLLALLPSRPAPDPVGVAHWVAVSNRPGAGTLYESIRRLGPGAMLVLDRDGAREHRYWQPRFQEPLDITTSQLAKLVREALGTAVERRLDPNGITAVLMSGGLDSAAVAAVAAAAAPGRVSACSGVFPEHAAVDESDLIAELRGRLALGGVTAEVRPGGLLASALEFLDAWELPLLAWGDFWMLPLLRAAASTGVRTTLGGDGGDELFGARAYLLADRLRAGHPRDALRWALELPGAGDRPPRRQVAGVLRDSALLGALPYGLHDPWRRRFAASRAPGWLHPSTKRNLIDSDDPLAWKRLDGPRWWAHVAHGLTSGVEQAGVFEHQHRRAVLAGVRAHHPLFDLDVVELGLRQPPEATFDRYRSRPVLRASMDGMLPDSVRLRPAKAWFDSLIFDCLAGPDGAVVRQLLTDPAAELCAHVDQAGMRRALFEREPSDRFRWMHQVWRLVTAECWLRAQAGSKGGVLPAGCEGSRARVTLRSEPREMGVEGESPGPSAPAVGTVDQYLFPS